MLFNLLTSLIDQYSFLNVFRYLTFRTGLSVVSSLIIVFIIGGPLIKLFSEKMITGPIRQDGPIDHIVKKSGTPTMGGVIIIIGIISSTILWADLTNIYVWTLIFVSLSLGALGFPVSPRRRPLQVPKGTASSRPARPLKRERRPRPKRRRRPRRPALAARAMPEPTRSMMAVASLLLRC